MQNTKKFAFTLLAASALAVPAVAGAAAAVPSIQASPNAITPGCSSGLFESGSYVYYRNCSADTRRVRLKYSRLGPDQYSACTTVPAKTERALNGTGHGSYTGEFC